LGDVFSEEEVLEALLDPLSPSLPNKTKEKKAADSERDKILGNPILRFLKHCSS